MLMLSSRSSRRVDGAAREDLSGAAPPCTGAPRALMDKHTRCSASACKSTNFPAGRVLARASNGPCPDTLRAFSCPDDCQPWHSVRTTHRSVSHHRIARSGLAIESNRLCDVDRNRSDGAGGLRRFRVRPSPKCLVKTQPATRPASDSFGLNS